MYHTQKERENQRCNAFLLFGRGDLGGVSPSQVLQVWCLVFHHLHTGHCVEERTRVMVPPEQ